MEAVGRMVVEGRRDGPGYGLMGQVSDLKCVFALAEQDGLLVKANISPRDWEL